MTAPEYTEDGLPVLTQRTIDAYIAEYHDPGRSERPRVDMGELIRRENPALAKYLGELIESERTHRGDEHAEGLTQGLAIMYGLLMRQGSTNRLEEGL